MLAMNAFALGQSAKVAPAAKSAEQVALKRGQEALNHGDIARARTEFEKAVRLAPNDAEAQSALGWVLTAQGEPDAAVAHLRAAIKARPGFVDPRLILAGVLSLQGKPAEAEQEARAAVKIAPGNAEAHRTLAKILSQQPGDEALSEMRRAVELAPERADLRDDLGNILAQRNQFADAEISFKEALRLQPNLEQAHFHLGVVRLQEQQLDEAADELAKALALSPQDAVAHYYLAKTLTAQSKSADALQELRKAAALKPDWFELQIELGIACQRAADADGAVAAFGAAVKLHPAGCGGLERSWAGAGAEGRGGEGNPCVQDGVATASGRRHASRESSDRVHAAVGF